MPRPVPVLLAAAIAAIAAIAAFAAFAALAAAAAPASAAAHSAVTRDDSGAVGVAVGSPGVISGNVVQVPVHVPVEICGNSVDVVGLLNPTFGNTCVNG
jgi:ChpA-C